MSGYAFLCVYPVSACSSFFPVDLCPLSNWGIFQTLTLQIFVLARTSFSFPSGDFSDTNLLPYIAEDLWLF